MCFKACDNDYKYWIYVNLLDTKARTFDLHFNYYILVHFQFILKLYRSAITN